MKTVKFLLLSLLLVAVFGCENRRSEPVDEVWHIVSDETIDLCAADFDCRYALFVKGNEVYVGYYDSEHNLKVAKRDSVGEWSYTVMDENVSWDSHKYISLAVDCEDIVHVSCNMHNDPLVYYHSVSSGDISTIKRDTMTMIFEDSVTYPEFLYTDDMFVFHYRNGRSGNGSTYFNTYDFESDTWSKLCEEPLFDGLDESNSYFKGPALGPDGKFHLIWCWRDESDCSTNHGLYYAFSEDLKEWHTPSGYSKMMPLTPRDDEFLIDDIKVREGLINGGFAVGFDEESMPVIAYHKYDENDHTNLYSATFRDGGWTCCRITDWDWKWEFSGRGSIPFDLVVHRTWCEDNRQYIYISRAIEEGIFRKKSMQDLLICYDESNGTCTETPYSDNPQALNEAENRGLLVHREYDRGESAVCDSVKYLLRYETRFPVRDKRQSDRKVPTSSLRLVKIQK